MNPREMSAWIRTYGMRKMAVLGGFEVLWHEQDKIKRQA